MTKPLKIIVDCLTGVEETVEMTDNEYAAHLEMLKNAQPLAATNETPITNS